MKDPELEAPCTELAGVGCDVGLEVVCDILDFSGGAEPTAVGADAHQDCTENEIAAEGLAHHLKGVSRHKDRKGLPTLSSPTGALAQRRTSREKMHGAIRPSPTCSKASRTHVFVEVALVAQYSSSPGSKRKIKSGLAIARRTMFLILGFILVVASTQTKNVNKTKLKRRDEKSLRKVERVAPKAGPSCRSRPMPNSTPHSTVTLVEPHRNFGDQEFVQNSCSALL